MVVFGGRHALVVREVLKRTNAVRSNGRISRAAQAAAACDAVVSSGGGSSRNLHNHYNSDSTILNRAKQGGGGALLHHNHNNKHEKMMSTNTTTISISADDDEASSSSSSSSSKGRRSKRKQKGSREEVSKVDVQIQEKKSIRLSDVLISEVLKQKHAFRWVDPVIYSNATVQDAIRTTIDGGLSGMMVLESPGTKKVVGLLTSRDLLRIMAMGIEDGDDSYTIMNRTIGDYMTPISQVIYGRPSETIGMCRTIMSKLGIKCLPILGNDNCVEGLITAKDMSDFGLSAKDRGGKKSFLDDVSERVGLSSNTSMAEPPPFLLPHLALEQTPLFINTGVAELPHPFKNEKGVGMNQREFRSRNYSTDPQFSEDAYFMKTVQLPSSSSSGGSEKNSTTTLLGGSGAPPSNVEVTYMGVADGVGSWREYGVDPRDFSRRLMEECGNVVNELSGTNTTTTTTTNDNNHHPDSNRKKSGLTTSEILERAYKRVCDADIVGSCTACVAMFDNTRHQLHFSNLGDSGIIVLRHIDSDVAGALKRNRNTPRLERKSDLNVAFVSQQQLHSFNHPFQLGWRGKDVEEERERKRLLEQQNEKKGKRKVIRVNMDSDADNNDDTSFKSAKDACVTSVHIRRGDIIIMATDGLFDNVDVDDIASMALEWENHNGFIRGGDIMARERRWKMGNSLSKLSEERIGDLAKELVVRARTNSLDKKLDSPFAILAKENDIMWSGGMPDDCTVIVMHVVGRNSKDLMDKDHM